MSSHNWIFPDPEISGPMDWSVSAYGAAPMSLGPDPFNNFPSRTPTMSGYSEYSQSNNYGFTAPPPPAPTQPGFSTSKDKGKSRAMVNRTPLHQASGSGKKPQERTHQVQTPTPDHMSWANDSFFDFFGSTSDGVMAPVLPQNLNPECTRPNQWTTKSPGDTCTWKSQKLDKLTGLPQPTTMLMYPTRNPKITGPMKAPSITFTKVEELFPPTIRCLVFDESGLLAHHNDPLFLPPLTKEERKAYLTILYDIPYVDLFWETIPKYHRGGRSLTRGELAIAVANVLWGTWVNWQEKTGCSKEWEIGKAYSKPTSILVDSDPWRLELVRPRRVRLAGLNCFGEVWVPVICMDRPWRW